MKYIKKFENINTPEVGDYVLCQEDGTGVPELENFLKYNIGKIVKCENIPKNIQKYMFDNVR